MAFNTKKAAEELAKANIHQIQSDTAYSWGSRAWVSYTNFIKSKDVRWFFDAKEYEHESLEHAALIQAKFPLVLKEIQDKLEPLKKEADLIIKKKSFV
jgi:hypothetical protein